MSCCDKSHTNEVKDVIKALHECDFGLIKDDGCKSGSEPSPFSAWSPARGGGGARDVCRRDNHERPPRVQQSIARKVHRLFPPSLPGSFNWRPMVEKRTYKYVADNGCYRRAKSGAPDAAAAGKPDCCESSVGWVDARLRQYLRRLGDSRGGAGFPALADRPAQTAAAAAGPRGFELAAAAAGVVAAAAAALWRPVRSLPGGSAAAAVNSPTDSRAGVRGWLPDDVPRDSVDPVGPEDVAEVYTPVECDPDDDTSSSSPPPPLQLPALFGGFGAAYAGGHWGAASVDNVVGTLGIDQKLRILDAELARDLAMYGSATDASWASLLDGGRPPSSLAPAGSPAFDRAARGYAGKSRPAAARAAAAAQTRRRFAKLRYITREGDIVHVPVYGCSVALRTGAPPLDSSKKAHSTCLTVSGPGGFASAIVERAPEVAGIKYRLTKRTAASYSSPPN